MRWITLLTRSTLHNNCPGTPTAEALNKYLKTNYGRTSIAQTPIGPGKLIRDRGSSNQSGLIIAQGQEA